ncbi:MAG: ABC transporter ATP-binding protein [Variibacter sp.]
MPLLEVADLRVRFSRRERITQAVAGVDLSVEKGEMLGLLGESGCGKSVTLRSIMKLLPERGTTIDGRIRIDGLDILSASPDTLRRTRGPKVAMIFQEPLTALDPVATIGNQIAEVLIVHEGLSRAAARARAKELLDLVQIPMAGRRIDSYPHELSGGLRQRAMIALAIVCKPLLLLADEPTTALDATVQIQILLLLRKLQSELGMAAIVVTHDIGVAAEISDRVAIMYGGQIMESGPASDVLTAPAHPYTRALLGATLRPGVRGRPLNVLKGSPPDLSRPLHGCRFAERCVYRMDFCTAADPSLVPLADGRTVRCCRVGSLPDAM